MLEEKKVQEECLYCHGQMKLDPCPVCGDTKRGGVSEARSVTPANPKVSAWAQV